jgi:hypothetical protein
MFQCGDVDARVEIILKICLGKLIILISQSWITILFATSNTIEDKFHKVVPNCVG